MSVLTRQVPAGVMRTIHKEWVPHLSANVTGYLFEGNDRNPFSNTDTAYDTSFASVTQSGQPTAPDGTGTWCKVTEDSNTVYHIGGGGFMYYCTANLNGFGAVYARPGTRTHLSIWLITTNGTNIQYSIVDLTAGTVSYLEPGMTVTVRPAPDGTGKVRGDSGWLTTWLVMVKWNQGTTNNADGRIRIGIANGPAKANASYTGNGSGYIYLWRNHGTRNADYCAIPIYGTTNNAIGTGNVNEGTYGAYGTGVAADPPYVMVLPSLAAAVKAVEVRLSMVDRGVFYRGNDRGVFCYGAAPAGTGGRFGLRGNSAGTGLEVFHHNGTSEVSVAVPGTMGFLQHLSLVVSFAMTGVVTVTATVNGVSAGSASTSALTPAGSWGAGYCYFGGLSPDPTTCASAMIHDFEIRI